MVRGTNFLGRQLYAHEQRANVLPVFFYVVGMDMITAVTDAVALFVIILGASLSSVFFAYVGIQWMASLGDPQRGAVARSSFVGVFIGLVLIGIAMLVPNLVSVAIIEPVGGVPVQAGLSRSDCDGILKRQLQLVKTADGSASMNRLIDEVQAVYGACGQEDWDPEVNDAGASNCEKPDGRVGGLNIPPGFKDDSGGDLVNESGRDDRGNILVLWGERDHRPSDGSICWMYFEELDTWREV